MKWEIFLRIYDEGMEKWVSKMKITQESKEEWYNKICAEAKEVKERAWNRWRRNKRSDIWNEFKRARNDYVSTIRNEKQNFQKNIVDKCKEQPKLFYVRNEVEKVVKIIQEEENNLFGEIEEVFRLGIYQEGKHRPLKIRFRS